MRGRLYGLIALLLLIAYAFSGTSQAAKSRSQAHAIAHQKPQYDLLYSSRHYLRQGRSCFQIRRLSLGGGESTQLTHAYMDCQYPLASPAGKWIAYTQPEPVKFTSCLWLMTASGSRSRHIPTPSQWTEIRLSKWPPGGHGLVLYVYAAVIQLDPLTGQRRKLKEAERYGLSPAGDRIAEVAADSSGDVERLEIHRASDDLVLKSFPLTNKNRHGEVISWGSCDWAPSGKMVLLGALGGTSTAHYDDYELVDLRTGKETYLGQGRDASWSPDSRYLAWVTMRDLMPLDKKRQVWTSQVVVHDRATGRTRQLTSGLQWNQQPSWILRGR